MITAVFILRTDSVTGKPEGEAYIFNSKKGIIQCDMWNSPKLNDPEVIIAIGQENIDLVRKTYKDHNITDVEVKYDEHLKLGGIFKVRTNFDYRADNKEIAELIKNPSLLYTDPRYNLVTEGRLKILHKRGKRTYEKYYFATIKGITLWI